MAPRLLFKGSEAEMGFLSRRHVWITDLIGIGIGSALAGHAAATLLAAALLPAALPSRRAQMAAPPPVAMPDKSIEGIVGRNMFCSTCGGAPFPEQTRRALTLLAIMFAPPPSDPRWSVAIVRDDEMATTGPYGVGARLGDARIEAIEEVRVILDVGHGRRELLELLHRRARVPSDGRRAPPGGLGDGDGIRKTGTHSYEIRRAALEQFLAGGVASSWPRVAPQSRDGELGGLRLFGVRPGSPFAALGLADGDLLMQVNGRSIATPDAALAAYATLRTASHVWLVIERAGQRIRIDYAVP